MRTVAVTGHRPEKIDDPVWVKHQIKDALENVLLCDYLIQGMAAGVDLWSAQIARSLGIMYECARPWSTHSPRKADQKVYNEVLHFADKITVVNEAVDYPGPWVYAQRNKYMMQAGETILAVWDGSKGGTYNAVGIAKQLKKPIYCIDPVKRTWGWYANAPV